MKAVELKSQLPIQAKDKDYWKKLIEDYEATGLTRSEYCRMHQINYDNFGYWWKKLKNESVKSLIPIKIKSQGEQHSEKNLPLSTLTFKNGNSLHIYNQESLLLILSKLI